MLFDLILEGLQGPVDSCLVVIIIIHVGVRITCLFDLCNVDLQLAYGIRLRCHDPNVLHVQCHYNLVSLVYPRPPPDNPTRCDTDKDNRASKLGQNRLEPSSLRLFSFITQFEAASHDPSFHLHSPSQLLSNYRISLYPSTKSA